MDEGENPIKAMNNAKQTGFFTSSFISSVGNKDCRL
jgi:hypothetical protein